jgi:hypothetical protein
MPSKPAKITSDLLRIIGFSQNSRIVTARDEIIQQSKFRTSPFRTAGSAACAFASVCQCAAYSFQILPTISSEFWPRLYNLQSFSREKPKAR